MHFALRGVEEQYNLVPNQFIRFPHDTSVYNSDVYYEYTEFISKNNQHRFKDINMRNKIVRTYAQISNERCVVKLLDFYLAKLKPDSSFYYMHPLEKIPKECDKSWYTAQRVSVNTLKNIIPKLSLEAGCDVRYTNHSLRPTSTTRMFSGGVPEKLIAEKTGHRSLQSLRCYERTQMKMEQAINSVIADPEHSFSTESSHDIEAKYSILDKLNDPFTVQRPHSKDSKKCEACILKSSEYGFSGTLNNCTINISYK